MKKIYNSPILTLQTLALESEILSISTLNDKNAQSGITGEAGNGGDGLARQNGVTNPIFDTDL